MNSTLYTYSTVSSRISSMNSYLLATGDPSRSTLRLFSGRSLPSRALGYAVRAPSSAPAHSQSAPHRGPAPAASRASSPSRGGSPGSGRVLGQLRRSSCSTSARSGLLPRGTPASTCSMAPLHPSQLFRATLLVPCTERSEHLSPKSTRGLDPCGGAPDETWAEPRSPQVQYGDLWSEPPSAPPTPG